MSLRDILFDLDKSLLAEILVLLSPFIAALILKIYLNISLSKDTDKLIGLIILVFFLTTTLIFLGVRLDFPCISGCNEPGRKQGDPERPSGGPTPPAPAKIDPLWAQLQTSIDTAKSMPSAGNDLLVKNVRAQITAKSLVAVPPEQNKEVQEADEAIERLAQSDARLNKFRASVAAWQARSLCELPTAFDADARLTDYDHRRLSDTEYQQGIRVLAEARALLGWQDKGLSRKTPVFIFSSSQAEIPRSIAGKLQSRLTGRLNVVSWQHAAACIELKSVIKNSLESEDSDGSSTLRLNLYFEARWLSGIAIDIPNILTSPVIQTGTISSINTDTLEQATAVATAEAERQLLSLTRTASDP